jgi:hypothetical protein
MLQQSSQIFFQDSSKTGPASYKIAPRRLKALGRAAEALNAPRLVALIRVSGLKKGGGGLPCQRARLYGIVIYPSRNFEHGR